MSISMTIVVNVKLSPFPLLSVMNALTCFALFPYYQLWTHSLILPFSLYVINNNFGWAFVFICKPAEVPMSAGGYRQTECRLPTCPVSITDMTNVGASCRSSAPLSVEYSGNYTFVSIKACGFPTARHFKIGVRAVYILLY